MPYGSELPEEDNQSKMKFLVVAMAALQLLVKSTYKSWLCYSDEAESSHSDYVVEALLAYWLSWHVLPSGL